MCAPDAGERALVAEEGMELPALASENLREPGRVEVERVRPEVAEVLVELRGCDEPHARPFLLPGLGQHELAAVREPRPEHRRLRSLCTGREVAQPAGAHEVDAEDEIVAIEWEEEVLPASARALEAPPVELGERRSERLERRDMRGPGLLDGRAGYQRVELANPGFDLRELGHPLTVALRPCPAGLRRRRSARAGLGGDAEARRGARGTRGRHR